MSFKFLTILCLFQLLKIANSVKISDPFENNVYIYSPEEGNFDENNEYCKTQNATMVTIKSSLQNQFITNFIENTCFINLRELKTGNGSNRQFISLGDRQVLTIGDSKVFQNWGYREPNLSVKNSTCSVISKVFGGIWKDYSCSNTFSKLCVRDARSGQRNDKTSDIVKFHDGMLYYFNMTNAGFWSHVESCKRSGMDLAIVRNKNQLNMMAITLHEGCMYGCNAWIGSYIKDAVNRTAVNLDGSEMFWENTLSEKFIKGAGIMVKSNRVHIFAGASTNWQLFGICRSKESINCNINRII